MREISGVNKGAMSRFIDTLRDNYRETHDHPEYNHGPLIVLIEGLVAGGQFVINIGERFDRWLEKPRDPLTPEQVQKILDLEQRIDGLKVSRDYTSIKNRTVPTMMYAELEDEEYRGRLEFLGTFYGSKFDVFARIDGDARKQQVVDQIVAAYLPDVDNN